MRTEKEILEMIDVLKKEKGALGLPVHNEITISWLKWFEGEYE